MRLPLLSAVLIGPAFAALAEVPRVVTDIPPVHALVSQVMGDLGTPDLLLEPGASEHDFQLRPSQAAGLADAELVVWIGPELTPWLDRALEGLGEDSARLGLLAVPGTYLQDFSADGAHGTEPHDHGHESAAEAEHGEHAEDSHAAEAGHDDHAEEGHDAEAGHDGHDHAGVDPHAWLDPNNARLWLTAIAEELSRLDPANAATYTANATTAAEAITALDADLAQRLAPVKDRSFIVFHDAYGYFAAHYGVQIAGSIALGDATAPGAARLEALGTRATSVACVFPESQHDKRLAEQLASESGARLGAPLDPNGSTLTMGPGLYAALMTGLVDNLTGCVAP